MAEERRNLFTPTKVENRRDPRWALCNRPLIITGGELTLADLDLKYSSQAKFYTAPLQMKANCGILVIDDFGRQLVPPAALLNRWIVPMEARVDYLSLLSGDTIEMPFELFLVFSTNIPPHQLGDEAFFRRIRHKIEVGDPDEPGFLEILRKICAHNNIPYSHEAGHVSARQVLPAEATGPSAASTLATSPTCCWTSAASRAASPPSRRSGSTSPARPTSSTTTRRRSSRSTDTDTEKGRLSPSLSVASRRTPGSEAFRPSGRRH